MKRLLAVLALAGCTEVIAAPEDLCGRAEVEGLVGENLAAVTMPTREGPVRVIKPGQMVTMDYKPSRLNIDVDDAGTITRVWCG